MSSGPNFSVAKRRRREQKTDYEKRLALLKSDSERIAVRTSNKHTRAQIITYEPEGDKTTVQAVSSELSEYGWEHSTSNVPAAYLTGLLLGQRSSIEQAVFDSGTKNLKKGSRRFAAIAGAREAGLNIPVDEESLPQQTRITGEHIEQMKDTDIVENFQETKQRIFDK